MPDTVPTIRDLSEQTGLSMRQIAIRFGIPYRTVISWATGDSNPPAYFMRILADQLLSERKTIPPPKLTYRDCSDIGDALTFLCLCRRDGQAPPPPETEDWPLVCRSCLCYDVSRCKLPRLQSGLEALKADLLRAGNG